MIPTTPSVVKAYYEWQWAWMLYLMPLVLLVGAVWGAAAVWLQNAGYEDREQSTSIISLGLTGKGDD